MEDYISGLWALPFWTGVFFSYSYYRDRFNNFYLWFGIVNFALTIWAFYESLSNTGLEDTILEGVIISVGFGVLLLIFKIVNNREKKKEKAWRKRNEESTREVKEKYTPIKTNQIDTTDNKISAHLCNYRDFIDFNEYLIGKEVYGASMNEEFHTYIKIQKEDIGKFNYDLILKFLNESTKHENYLSPSISLKGLCREYSIKFEEKYEKLKELTNKDTYGERTQTDEEMLKEQLDTGEFDIKGNNSLTPVRAIHDWNGMYLSVAENPDKTHYIIFYDPKEKVWKKADSIDFYTYYKCRVWIEGS